MFGASCCREDSGRHHGYSQNGVGLHIQFDGTTACVVSDGVVFEGMSRACILVSREPHVRTTLVIVDNKGRDIVASAVGWVYLLREHAADDSDGMANRTADVETENDGNARLDVWEYGIADVWTEEAERQRG